MSVACRTALSPSLGEAAPRARRRRARTARRVLAAAERLFAERGPANVTMDAVAAEAGVGKGTLFRRFGDRAGLARAVISEHEIAAAGRADPRRAAARPGRAAARAPARLRPRLPGVPRAPRRPAAAPPRARTRPPGWQRAYAFYRTHVALLLREAGCGDARRLPRRRRCSAPLAAPTFALPPRAARAARCEELVEAYADLVRAAS